MNVTPSSGPLDVEAFINRFALDLGQSHIEEKKATRSAIQGEAEIVRSKRRERIENLVKQIRGMAAGQGVCFKFVRSLFKVIDFLAKPLSLLTLNKLEVDLTKTLDTLKEQKNQQGLSRLQIRGEEILRVIQEFKGLLTNDTERLRVQEEEGARETKRVLEILDEIHKTFGTTTRL